MAVNLPAELQKLSGVQKVVYGGGALLGLAIFAPIAALALQTVTSIAMAAIVGLGLFMGFSALPLIVRWWRIQVFKMTKAVVRQNPVEALQLELIDRRQAFEAAEAQVVAVTSMRDSLREKLEDYAQKHRTNDASLARSVTQLSDLVDRLRTSLRQAGFKLAEFEVFVERQADRWKLAKATGELAALLKEANGGDVTERFLHDEAVDSIRTSLNTSFAEIDQVLQKEQVRQIVEEERLIPGNYAGMQMKVT